MESDCCIQQATRLGHLLTDSADDFAGKRRRRQGRIAILFDFFVGAEMRAEKAVSPLLYRWGIGGVAYGLGRGRAKRGVSPYRFITGSVAAQYRFGKGAWAGKKMP
ncbi:MAG: hypothetical protein M2R45_05218 [Verrucomicrobia subdivision 3 bacterium]|nr:hypothetical protein [Limisphaerales bacterium]MCS1417452.1 hypothetical protein [Limisphaerales bacterium]